MIGSGALGYLGEGLLVAALCFALLQASYLAHGANMPIERAAKRLQLFLTLQTGFVALSFLVLAFAYAVSDFSLLNVFLNSHTQKPLIYKITGSWGNHEGSMLLWVLILAAMSWLTSRSLRDERLRVYFVASQGLLIVGLYAFIWLTSNPFTVIPATPLEGQGLNPLLQDIGLAIHPPMLYLGYVGSGVVFLLAIAGMLHQVDRDWAKQAQPWITLSWAFLTLGIGLGSWWAYRELGWGGWWFWDPVENVSLLPWFALTALMHSNRVLMQRSQHVRWTLLLAITAFAMSLIGTFIVRSGILVSVHSFASDPDRGLFILLYVAMTVGTTLLLFARFKPQTVEPNGQVALWSRQGLIVVNNLVLLAAMLTVLIAIIYPLILQALKLPSVTVGPPYFNQTILPMMAPLVLLAGVAPLMPWIKARSEALLLWLALPAATLVVAAVIAFVTFQKDVILVAGGVGLGAWLAISTIQSLRKQRKHQGRILKSRWAMAAGHLGFALFTVALAINGTQSQEAQIALSQTGGKALGYHVSQLSDETAKGHNYHYRRAQILVDDGSEAMALTPELRFYPVRDMQTVEAAIHSTLWRDVYLTLTLQPDSGSLEATLRDNPAILWVWVAFALTACGGVIAAYHRFKTL